MQNTRSRLTAGCRRLSQQGTQTRPVQFKSTLYVLIILMRWRLFIESEKKEKTCKGQSIFKLNVSLCVFLVVAGAILCKQKGLLGQICQVISCFKPTRWGKCDASDNGAPHQWRKWTPRSNINDTRRAQIALTAAPELTSTSMTPDSSRAPKIISKEPTRNRNMASAMALYGTFGGLFLNCEVWQKSDRRERKDDRTYWVQVQRNIP